MLTISSPEPATDAGGFHFFLWQERNMPTPAPKHPLFIVTEQYRRVKWKCYKIINIYLSDAFISAFFPQKAFSMHVYGSFSVPPMRKWGIQGVLKLLLRYHLCKEIEPSQPGGADHAEKPSMCWKQTQKVLSCTSPTGVFGCSSPVCINLVKHT